MQHDLVASGLETHLQPLPARPVRHRRRRQHAHPAVVEHSHLIAARDQLAAAHLPARHRRLLRADTFGQQQPLLGYSARHHPKTAAVLAIVDDGIAVAPRLAGQPLLLQLDRKVAGAQPYWISCRVRQPHLESRSTPTAVLAQLEEGSPLYQRATGAEDVTCLLRKVVPQ